VPCDSARPSKSKIVVILKSIHPLRFVMRTQCVAYAAGEKFLNITMLTNSRLLSFKFEVDLIPHSETKHLTYQLAFAFSMCPEEFVVFLVLPHAVHKPSSKNK